MDLNTYHRLNEDYYIVGSWTTYQSFERNTYPLRVEPTYMTGTVRLAIPLFLVSLMLASVLISVGPEMSLESEEIGMTEGRQGLGEVNCENYTFEDLFGYNHALFEMDIHDDWTSTTTLATAWVNDSLAANVRDAMDSLFPTTAGGDNDWLSTDEREGVRSVGPKCVAQMNTRIGLKEGQPHRGGVDWNELEWVEKGIALDELDLIPENHPQERDCQHLAQQQGCREVPVEITDNLEIYLLQSEEEDYNMVYNQLPSFGVQPFTMAMNVTNMTEATLQMTLPAVEGLRIASFEVQEDGVGVEAPQPVVNSMEDGRLEVIVEIEYDVNRWPVGKNLYIDFTTADPPPDYPPSWSSSAPTESTSMPILLNGGKTLLANQETMQSWTQEETAVDFNCSISNNWQLDYGLDGLFIIPGSGESADLTCTPTWREKYGNNHTGTPRTWIVEQPISFTAVAGEYMDSVNISMASVNGDRSGLSVSLTPVQGDSSAETSVKAGPATEAIITTDISVMSPGPVLFDVEVTGDGILDWMFTLDLGIIKESRAPQITVSKTRDGENGTWDDDGYQYTMSGTVFDADGDEVSITVEVCGYKTIINPDGSTWSSDISIVGCDNQDEYLISLTAIDDWDKSMMISVNVAAFDEDASSTPVSAPPSSSSEEGGLPAPGLLATLGILAIAGVWISRRGSNLS